MFQGRRTADAEVQSAAERSLSLPQFHLVGLKKSLERFMVMGVRETIRAVRSYKLSSGNVGNVSRLEILRSKVWHHVNIVSPLPSSLFYTTYRPLEGVFFLFMYVA